MHDQVSRIMAAGMRSFVPPINWKRVDHAVGYKVSIYVYKLRLGLCIGRVARKFLGLVVNKRAPTHKALLEWVNVLTYNKRRFSHRSIIRAFVFVDPLDTRQWYTTVWNPHVETRYHDQDWACFWCYDDA